MELDDMNELFDDQDDEAMIQFLRNIRTYTVRDRTNHCEKWDDHDFFLRFRMSKNTARALLAEIEELLTHNSIQYHQIDPLDQLLLTLRFYSTGDFYVCMGDFVGIHKTTAGRIIERTTSALITLRPRYIKFPQDDQSKERVQHEFYKIARFPKIIGAIDCTHVPIQSPGGEHAETYRNRKGFFSLNVQVVCNSDYLIQDIVARWPGSCHDSHIFNNSNLKNRFENGEFQQCILLGDSGYPLTNYLMTPIPQPQTPAQVMYNNAHISTRCVIERTFGIFKRKFNILKCGIRSKLPLTQKIILACAVVHNICILNKENIEDEADINHEEQELHLIHNDNNIRNLVQVNYINYFQNLL